MNKDNKLNILDDGYKIKLPFLLNDQQKNALVAIDRFINSDEHTMTVSGFAGTGKTTLMEVVKKRYSWKINPKTNTYYRIQFAATTHKAAGVLRMKVMSKVHTVNSLFGIMVETNLDVEDYDANNKKNTKGEDKLKPDSVVIIDEASMLSVTNYNDVISKCDELGCKVIFIGDPAQLAPVNEDEISIVFRAEHPMIELTDIERTDDDAILKESMAVRETGHYSYQSDYKDGRGVRYVNLKDGQALSDTFETHIPGLKTDPNWFRVLTYTNTNVEKLNATIRAKLGYPDLPQPGEPMMGYANWGYDGGEYKFINSESYTVSAIVGEEKVPVKDYIDTDEMIIITYIKLKDSLGNTVTVPYIDIKSRKSNYNVVRKLAYEKINLWQKWRRTDNKLDKIKLQVQINEIENFLFVNDNVRSDTGKVIQPKIIDFGYVHTIHKSQGSTFENVMINDIDIDFHCSDSKTKKQLRYVAITRARQSATIITDGSKGVKYGGV